MKLSDFDFELPAELIAQHPAEQRDSSRLMVLDRQQGAPIDARFPEIVDYLRSGDLLVVNDTRVMPARLLGRKPTGGSVEVLLVRPLNADCSEWLAMTRSSKPLRPGTSIDFGPLLQGELVEEGADLLRRIRLTWQGEFDQVLERVGRIPLPPYIRREDDAVDRERYQTMFARARGSVAAPTAGLHFTPEILARLASRGVEIGSLTLHVGPGTFLPVRVEEVTTHRMHTERYEIAPRLAEQVSAARREGRRVVAVGTTTTRALEAASDETGCLRVGGADTDIFIYPGYRFRVVDAMVTNFHLPCSTLLMLVCAFAGKDRTLSAYRHAVSERYRFFSYGDCMLIA